MHEKKWLSLKVKDMYQNGNRISINSQNLKLGFAAGHALVKYIKVGSGTGSKPVQNFLYRLDWKVQKNLALTYATGKVIKVINLISTVCNLTSLTMPANKNCGKLLGFWNKSYLPLHIRTFCYQLYSNSLLVGARLVNRNRNQLDWNISMKDVVPVSVWLIWYPDCTHFFWVPGNG